jgi:protein O-mannosyl-transferase
MKSRASVKVTGKPSLTTRHAKPNSKPAWKWHAAVVGTALLLTLAAYSNALRGSFVYDDKIQIVGNPYIQHRQYFWQAMVSDVWAFKGVQDEASSSNYWRPLFVAWLAMNYKLFGLDTTGWHALNIFAHLLVTLLGYRVLVALQLKPATSAIAAWLFATHPAHVQSVTWISGAPDVLMSAFLFGSFNFYLALRRNPHWFYWAGALLFYSAALLSKETAIVFPAIIFLSDWALSNKDKLSIKASLAFRRALPFFGLASVFILLRYLVLHATRTFAPEAPGFGNMILTIPSILMFYVRQSVWPFGLGPIYGVRVVNADNLGLTNFFLPVLILVALGYGLYRLARQDSTTSIGLIWFLLPLIPVLDTRIFTPEMLVQDRYLYLPLFGAIILVSNGMVELVERLLRRNPQLVSCAVGLALAIALAIVARQYNPVWKDDIALWEHAVKVDPSSAMARAQLGDEYQRAGRLSEAKDTLALALELRPGLTNAHVSMGIIANRERRYDEAERYLKHVLSVYPNHDVALEQLGIAYQQQGKFNEAIALFDQGRRRMPYKRDSYTVNIAILQAMANRKAEAIEELELLIPRLNSVSNPDVLKAWWYLGELYREQRRTAQAISAYKQYLKVTEGMSDANVLRLRQLATQALESLS